MTVACEYERLRDGFLFRPDSSFSTVGAAEDYPYFCYKLWQWQWLKRMIKSTMMMTSTWWRRRRGVGGQLWEKVLFADKIFNKLQISKVIPDYFLFQLKIVRPFVKCETWRWELGTPWEGTAKILSGLCYRHNDHCFIFWPLPNYPNFSFCVHL